ncbi:MAG: phospholipase D-like domain-containing protein [Acidimicrobiia bacterium]|nr:phospholipase D-like domain-containing protein [Acidimicrobiia bacterium]
MTARSLIPIFPVRDGYRVVGAIPIAVPVSKVSLSVLVEEQSEILDSSRFLMAFMDEGIDRPDELARLMGLTNSLMETVIRQAYMSGFVFPMSDGTVSLTLHGREALSGTTRLEVSTDRVDLGVDRMTGQVFGWTDVERHLKIKQRDLNRLVDDGEIVAVPHPARPPTLEQLTAVDSGTVSVVSEIVSTSGRPRRLVEAVSIEGNVERFYRTDALALRVMPVEGGEREWDFLINGTLSETHAQGFLTIQEKRSRTILPEPPPHPLDQFEQVLELGEIDRLDLFAREKLVERLTLTERQRDLETRSVNAPSDTDISSLASALAEITSSLEAEPSLDPLDLPEVLEVHQHRPFLMGQLDVAEYRALIVSPWVTNNAFDREVESSVRRALARGVHVSIRYGYEEKGVAPSIESRLDQLAQTFQNFDHHDLGNSHVKLFAVDDRFVTGGSFNWLSFRGSPDRTFRDELSFIITKKDIVDTKFAQYLDDDIYLATRPTQEKLGTEIEGVVFVEGWTDKRFFEITAARADREDLLEGIDVRFEPPGAKGAAGAIIAFTHNNPDIPAIAVFDSDDIGQAAARHVKDYATGGPKSVVSYGDAYGAHRSDVEAEHLFPPALVQRFVDESGGNSVIDASRKNRKTGEMIYDINRESKDAFVEWVEAHIEPEDTQLWLVILKLVRDRLGLATSDIEDS